MADLIDRLTHDSESMTPPRPGLPVHAFTGGVIMRATGAWTDAEVIQAWDLQGAEFTQAQAILTTLNGKSNATAKIVYAEKVIAVALLLSHPPDSNFPNPNPYFDAARNANKARVALDLEITL